MSLFHQTVPLFAKNLKNIERWIDKVDAFAAAKRLDANTLLDARLAPDQFPLVRQIQSACDSAKLTPSRITGKEAPVHADTEKTWDEIRTRLRAVGEYLGTFAVSDFDGAEDRLIALPWMPGKTLTGRDYAQEFGLANFFFHYTTTYALLRHNGLELGKLDFFGSLPFRDA